VCLAGRCAVVTYQSEESASAAVNANATDDAVQLNDRLHTVISLSNLISSNLVLKTIRYSAIVTVDT